VVVETAKVVVEEHAGNGGIYRYSQYKALITRTWNQISAAVEQGFYFIVFSRHLAIPEL